MQNYCHRTTPLFHRLELVVSVAGRTTTVELPLGYQIAWVDDLDDQPVLTRDWEDRQVLPPDPDLVP